MDEFDARRAIVEVCRRMYDRGYVVAAEGNVSVRLPDETVLITPAGAAKGFLTPDAVVRVEPDGRVRGSAARPSSEIQLHLVCYRSRPDVRGVVHAHPPTAVGFTLAGVSLAECILPEVIVSLGDIPTAPYATTGTADLAASVERLVRGHDAVLLDHHGAVCLGPDPYEAFHRLEQVEHVARMTLTARLLGGARPLPREEVQTLLDLRRSMGLGPTPSSCNRCGACVTSGRAGGSGGR